MSYCGYKFIFNSQVIDKTTDKLCFRTKVQSKKPLSSNKKELPKKLAKKKAIKVTTFIQLLNYCVIIYD